MPSIFGPQSAPRRGLLGDSDEEPIIDRMSMLPIGQYADGSLTLAWPGMAKDAYDSIVNSYSDVAAGRTPKTSDVLTVASTPIMGNLAARAVGVMPEVALGVGASKTSVSKEIISAWHGTDALPFYKFNPKRTSEVGFHFGSKEQALAREQAKYGPEGTSSLFGWRTFPVQIEAENIADISKDVGRFTGHGLAQQLVADGLASPSLAEQARSAGTQRGTELVRQWLLDNGYDAVRYPNAVEGDGSSIMALGTGNVRDARTGRTLFANAPEAGLLPLGARAVNGTSELTDVLFGSKNASLYDPPRVPQRPFEADYPRGANADAAGRLTHDIDGVPLSAAYVAGRRTAGGGDVGLSPAEVDGVLRELGVGVKQVPPSSIAGDAGRYSRTYDRGGMGLSRSVGISKGLPEAEAPRVLAHETGHAIDDLAAGRAGIPTDGLKRELGGVYNTLNNPNRARDGSGAADWGKPARPEDFGYRGDSVPAELTAEAVRAYMADPNYMKTVAPKTAARIREFVNSNPRLSGIIQFNANPAEGSLLPLGMQYLQQGQTLSPGHPDPFDRWNDPLQEVPMMMEFPFGPPALGTPPTPPAIDPPLPRRQYRRG